MGAWLPRLTYPIFCGGLHANSWNPTWEALRKKAIEQNKRLVVIFASQGVLEAIAMIIGADLSGKVEVGRNWDGMLLKTGCLSKMGSMRRTSGNGMEWISSCLTCL